MLFMCVVRVYQRVACRSVLGDRSFSRPWGGSVLDSVIGTFLTQNVSDQLSSKAYMTLAATFPPKPEPATPLAATCPPKPGLDIGAATLMPKSGTATMAATFPLKSKPDTLAATFVPRLHPNTPPKACAEKARPATMEQGTGVTLPARASPDCHMGPPKEPSLSSAISERCAEGVTDSPAGVEPTPENAGVEGVRCSGVLGVCTLLGSTGSNQGGQSEVGSGPEGAVVPSDRAAEGSDSIDWEAVRLAPRSKVDISATNHDDCW